jgi:hypothetical protein
MQGTGRYRFDPLFAPEKAVRCRRWERWRGHGARLPLRRAHRQTERSCQKQAVSTVPRQERGEREEFAAHTDRGADGMRRGCRALSGHACAPQH